MTDVAELRVSPPGASRFFPFERFEAAVLCSRCQCNHSEDATEPNPLTEACQESTCPCHDEDL